MKIYSMNTTDLCVLQLFSEYDDYMIHFLGDDKKYYTRYSKNEHTEKAWVAYVDNLPIGCIAFRRKAVGVGEVKRLFIREEYRSRGISRVLLKTVADFAKKQDCHTLFLDTRITLHPAVSIYQAFGFRVVFQEGAYIQMEKEL